MDSQLFLFIFPQCPLSGKIIPNRRENGEKEIRSYHYNTEIWGVDSYEF